MKKGAILLIMSILTCFASDIYAKSASVFLLRYALVIGSNTATKSRPALRYAVSDAEAFSEVISSLGGVSNSNLISISNPSLEEFTKGIGKLESMVNQPSSGSGRKEIIFYYSGHADENGIILGKQSLPYPLFRKLIDKIPVDVRIVVLDACASGSITQEKGGTRRPAFLFDASSAMKGHAYLTSSSFDEAAQESDRIKGSFFTHSLVSAMRGGADANSDGKVTLNEAYKFAFDETLKRTEKTLSGPQHAAYDLRLKGSGDLVLTDLRVSNAGLQLPTSLSGRVFIRDKNGSLLAEMNKMRGKKMEIGLEPGIYEVTLEKPQEIYTSNVTLISGKYTVLNKTDMSYADVVPAVARGNMTPAAPTNRYDGYRIVPFNLSLLPMISIGGANQKIITNCAINVLAGYTAVLRGITISAGINMVAENAGGIMIGAGANFCDEKLNGIQIAGGFNKAHFINGVQITGGGNIAGGNANSLQICGGVNIVSESSNGAQITGGVNIAAADYKGIQISGGTNIVHGSQYGAQIAGGINFTVGNCEGVQIAGGANLAHGSYRGMQLSGGINATETITGTQIGVVNYGRSITGIQIGVVNVCDTLNGIALGVLSFIRNNPPRARLSTDESGYIQTGVRSGMDYFYSIFSFGMRPEFNPDKWQISYGLGTRIKIRSSFIGFEKLFLHSNEGWHWDSDLIYHSKNMLLFGYEFTKRFSVLGGPVLNTYWSKSNNDKKLAFWNLKYKRYKDNWYCIWPGFFIGIEFYTSFH